MSSDFPNVRPSGEIKMSLWTPLFQPFGRNYDVFRFPHFGLSGIFILFYCFSEFDNNLQTPKTHNVNTPTASATVQLCSYGSENYCLLA